MYASLEEFKHFLRVPTENDANDAEMEFALIMASGLVDKFCSRTFIGPGETVTSQYVSAYWDNGARGYLVDIADLANLDDLAVDWDSAGDSTYATALDVVRAIPVNGPAPYRTLVLSGASPVGAYAVRVTGNFGYPGGVPEAVKGATLLQANRFFKRRESPFGISGSPDSGMGELRLLSQIDPDVRLALLPYVRYWGARR